MKYSTKSTFCDNTDVELKTKTKKQIFDFIWDFIVFHDDTVVN